MNKFSKLETGSDAFSTWESPTPHSSQTWWKRYTTAEALLAHASLMLVTVAGLMIINLIATPRTWWSLAILVMWVTLVALHALATAAARFLHDDTSRDSASDRQKAARRSEWADAAADQSSPTRTGRINARPRGRKKSDVATASWDLTDQSERSWPESGGESENSTSEQDDLVEETGWAHAPADTDDARKIPWRAATDVAWLRHRENGTSPADRRTNETRT